LGNESLENRAPSATDGPASLRIWWFTGSWFTHVTVVPSGTVTLAGIKAKFWIVTVAAPVAGAGVAAGAGDDDP